MDQQFEVTIQTLADLERFAGVFAKTLAGGERIGLVGRLGAGKTTLVGLLHGVLGGQGDVDSPTFTLRQTYPVRNHPGITQIIHYDLYRLTKNDETALVELGIVDDWQAETALILLEWADRFPELIDEQLTHLITIDWDPLTDRRMVRCVLS